MKKIIVTGAAGFIGSNFVREALDQDYAVTIYDSLTYAGHMENISDILDENKCRFVQGDIREYDHFKQLLDSDEYVGVFNFAAESHVDNSISGPQEFIQTNINGTFNLLEACRDYYSQLSEVHKGHFRYLQVSTDEVYGSLGETGRFSEETSYKPNSPYSASKAGADHLVRAWFHTYQLPVITTNCSNNYGPRQFPEKLIPRMIQCALGDKALPVYGTGKNVRDWIHVKDHSRGILLAFEKGHSGETYCFGGNSERTNLEVVHSICEQLDKYKPRFDKMLYKEQIQFVEDRKGHDWRYAIDDSKAIEELGFRREFTNFESGLSDTIKWYLENKPWVESVIGKSQ